MTSPSVMWKVVGPAADGPLAQMCWSPSVDAVGVADFKQFAVFAADLAEAEIQGGEFAFDDRFIFVWRLLGEHGDEFLAEDESAGVGYHFPPGAHDVVAGGAECPGFEIAARAVFIPFSPERHIHLLEDVHVVRVRW